MTPRRLITLQSLQIFLTDALTFIHLLLISICIFYQFEYAFNGF